MIVRELISRLKEMNPETEVILQLDAEGNGYKKCFGVDDEYHAVCDTYDIEVYSTVLTANDNDLTEEEWDTMKNNKNAVILYP